MTRGRGRTQSCSAADARARLDQARKFLEVAELTAGEREIAASANVAGALAVLAGIAATDAACCRALGVRSRGQDHRQAADLVEQIEPGGKDAAKALRRLLDHKDTAEYGFTRVAGQTLVALLRRAEDLAGFAEAVVRR